MEELLITLSREILKGNITLTIIGVLLIVGFIVYYTYFISKNNKTNNEQTALQVENSINLIIEILKELQSSLNFFIRETNTELKEYDTKLSNKANEVETEIVRSIEDLETKLISIINLNTTTLTGSINSFTSSNLSSLETSVNRDLVDIRLQRKDIKDSLELNIKDIKFKLDGLQDLLKDESRSVIKISQILDSLKNSIDIINLMNHNIRLYPIKSNVSEE